MKYFCLTNLEAGRDSKFSFYMIMPSSEDNETPILKKEDLMEQHEYREFVQKYRPRDAIMVDYSVYRTEEKVHAAWQPEDFEKLIADGKAEKLVSGELQIEPSEKKDKHGVVRKKKKTSPLLILGIIGGSGLLLTGGFLFGMKNGITKAGMETTNSSPVNTAEDGMIIPTQNEIADDAEQITVTIDRSYSPVPVDDLQLKGAVEKGKAKITLPAFDKTDYFSHVQGYSWGFTSHPEGKKIEYYGGREYEFSADTKLYRVLVKYGGSGTKDDPYLIDYFDQLELMGEEKARGYFKQTADISFPEWASHTPICTVNELKDKPKEEYFEYDGGGYLIEHLDAPLFDKVSGAVIKNVNIRSSYINTQEYRDLGFIVCNAYNYHYRGEDGKIYETGETLIQHCTVSHSSITAEIPQEEDVIVTTTAVVYAPEVVPPDLEEYDEDGNPIEPTTTTEPEPTKTAEYAIGGITGNGGQIEDCYVTDFGIFAYLDDYILYAGGISGKPANVINSGVYYYSANGKELPECYGGNIQGCVARNIILNTELAAGGIAGIGSSNAENAMISNCYANELQFFCGEYENIERTVLKKQGVTGGVIAVDGAGKYGHTVTNTVSLSDFSVIGKKGKSAYDDTVRLAPAFAFYQDNIQSVINKNTVNPENPKEIFTGCFMFGEQGEFGDESGSLAYPSTIKDLLAKTVIQEENQNG